MENHKCSICDRIFTRDWNLKRHIQDLHRLYNYDKKENINQEFEENYYSQKSNNSLNTCPNPADHNFEFLPNPNFNPSQLEEEKRLSLDDKIRIQSILKNLENSLEKIFPKPNIVWTTWSLWCRCIQTQSDEPLKRFLINQKMGYLWSN